MNTPVAPERLVKLCPRCESERPVIEMHCEAILPDGRICNWSLADAPIGPQGPSPPPPQTTAALRRCIQGHTLESGDELCMICGGAPAPLGPRPEDPEPTVVDAWSIESPLPPGAPGEPWKRFVAVEGSRRAVLTLYEAGQEPDPAVYDVLRRMPNDHAPDLIATGRFVERAYEVAELIEGGTLADAGWLAADDLAALRRVVDELGRALSAFAEAGLRHRDIRPTTVLLRTRDPLDLVITGFGSARLADFDLEAVAPLELTRYSAPEAIVGAVSAASDWWSLGMVVLEQATSGRCFEGVDDQAFRLHVVTRGVSLPDGLDADVRALLHGLLARDPLRRWGAQQVQDWLEGKDVPIPEPEPRPGETGPSIRLAGRDFRRLDTFALAAAEAANWDDAKALTLRGSVATWLAERGSDPQVGAEVRRLVADETLDENLRHALVLMALNPALPLAMRGEIVTPAWLLRNPDAGYAIVTGEAVRHLERMGREQWLRRMGARALSVRERAKALDIETVEGRLRVAMLASSRANLDAERAVLRRLFPDTDHPGLAALMERARLPDEDIIVLIAASTHQFITMKSLSEAAYQQAATVGVNLEAAALPDLLALPRRDLFGRVDERIANFSRCSNEKIDEWADAFRVERRLPLERAVCILAVPADRWREPPRQQYVATLLELLEKRVSSAVGRGPLVRFVLGKTTPRLDLTELGSVLRPADALLNHVLSRTEVPIDFDAGAYLNDASREARLRRLVSHALTFRRETGIDGRYLGFPFVIARDARAATSTKPRLAPILLWPIVIDLQSGAVRSVKMMFDRDREEVRLNPALGNILGASAFEKWRAARDELLARTSYRASDVIDIFGALARPRGRALVPLPGKDAQVELGSVELVPAATLFNAEFTGQSIAEDLRQMRRRPTAGTALDAAIRVTATDPAVPEKPPVAEANRYNCVESDPSQDAAVLKARDAPGLLVEGPPGTGKSQTIVNMIADCVGRGETVLVVCQKQAALRVVEKRLHAEGLNDRIFLVGDAIRDRAAVVATLREQAEAVRQSTSGGAATLRQTRKDKGARIEKLEGELDRHHKALYAADKVTGMSARDLLGELIGLEAEGAFLSAPVLRPILGPFDRDRLARLEEACGPLASLWVESRFEGNPLHALLPFAVDEAVTRRLETDLAAFASAEEKRAKILSAGSPTIAIDDPERHRLWVSTHASPLLALPDVRRRLLSSWIDLFRAETNGVSAGRAMASDLRAIAKELDALPPEATGSALAKAVAGMPEAELRARYRAAVAAACPAHSFLSRLSPARWSARRRTRAFLADLVQPADDNALRNAPAVLDAELRLQDLRTALHRVQASLGLERRASPVPAGDLRRTVIALEGTMGAIGDAADAVLACPAREDAVRAAKDASTASIEAFLKAYAHAFEVFEACIEASKALSSLAHWFTPDWLAQCAGRMKSGASTGDLIDSIRDALATLPPFQRFRARAAHLETDAITVFAALRAQGGTWERITPTEREGLLRRTICREALLAWKSRLETEQPELGYEREEIQRKVETLATLDREMRELNRRLLATDIDGTKLGPRTAWDALTRLRGSRVPRMREIMDQGGAIGLMHLRPVWLMNPDVASRMLPLKAGLFDLVIYDEASQMPVEHAVPTLYRARRAVVSGDDKQMPPSSFFTSRSDEDEDEDVGDEEAEELTDFERAAYEDRWNRRDVQSCPDLLHLGRGTLPIETLQIHYRSNYRELIGFSNGAFYKGRLNVPARHPDDEVRRARPIEVVRVEGVYEEQMNRSEADRIVDLLANMWKRPPDERPSVGVVTFNRKQADVVEDAIEQRAAEDSDFLLALRRERERQQDGEDMSVFVKNVENVQGDERDVIIFSTTFGRDRRGTFRRTFGVLGQTGGERRLNVAVTRARTKVILVTSIPIADVSDWLSAHRAPDKPRDYLQAYLDYAVKVSGGDLDAIRADQARRSTGGMRRSSYDDIADGFSASVEVFLREIGYAPVAGVNDGDAFKIDYAIEDPRTGLFGIGIECDAPRHPLLARARAREIWRLSVLRRSIPRVHRVSSSAWYARGPEERSRLKSAVEAALLGGKA